MPSKDIRSEIKNMSPDQQELFIKFKDVAMAKNQKDKQMAFIKFLGFLKSKKGGISAGTLGEVATDSVTGMLGGGVNG